MRSFTHRATLAMASVAVLIGLGLGGCTTPTAPVHVPESPSATPVFASDEEALAAAKDAYAKYLEVSDQIASEGGKDPERIATVATGDLRASALEGFQQLRNSSWHSTGNTHIANFVEQEVDQAASPALIAYVCVDVSEVDVLDSSGTSVVSPDRPDLQAFQVSFDFQKLVLVPNARDPWTGTGICE